MKLLSRFCSFVSSLTYLLKNHHNDQQRCSLNQCFESLWSGPLTNLYIKFLLIAKTSCTNLSMDHFKSSPLGKTHSWIQKQLFNIVGFYENCKSGQTVGGALERVQTSVLAQGLQTKLGQRERFFCQFCVHFDFAHLTMIGRFMIQTSPILNGNDPKCLNIERKKHVTKVMATKLWSVNVRGTGSTGIIHMWMLRPSFTTISLTQN